MNLFDISETLATPHGVLVAVPIPDAPDPVPESALAALHPDEAAFALTLRGYRQVQFVGGRIALRGARRAVGAPLDPSLPDDRGAPRLPAGWAGSVSHKRDLAVAMVARDAAGTLGVDLEDYGPPRPAIMDRVLRPEELAEVMTLPEPRQWTATVIRFSLKESVYKALDPFVHRYVDFQEALVVPDLGGRARVSLHLKHAEGPFEVNARYEWWQGRVISSVRIKPGRPIP